MDPVDGERRWFWVTLALSSITIAAAVFASWELIENRFFRNVDYVTLHYLYITRGMASSLLLSFWAGWYVLRERRRSEEGLRRSHERYRGLLELFPGAVALYDRDLRLAEWNAGAERMYGFRRDEVLHRRLPVVPADKEEELERLLRQVDAGESALDIESSRQGKDSIAFDVQLSLLPFREPGEPTYFLEVTSDIRERVRLRNTMLQIEKLASMGKMAAGTAHHLNTPLAAMLLRVQMMRERDGAGPYAADLERLESSIQFAHQFVQRLLAYTQCVPVERQPQEVAASVESVVSFLAPSIHAKGVHVAIEPGTGRGKIILADRNLIEAVLLVLLGNALDAVKPGGHITISSRDRGTDHVEIRIEDDGCGIREEDLPHVFEPFFTTKPPDKGTGLGLAIAWNAVQEHGGSMSLSSELGKGTVASIELPLCRQPLHCSAGAA